MREKREDSTISSQTFDGRELVPGLSRGGSETIMETSHVEDGIVHSFWKQEV